MLFVPDNSRLISSTFDYLPSKDSTKDISNSQSSAHLRVSEHHTPSLFDPRKHDLRELIIVIRLRNQSSSSSLNNLVRACQFKINISVLDCLLLSACSRQQGFCNRLFTFFCMALTSSTGLYVTSHFLFWIFPIISKTCVQD